MRYLRYVILGFATVWGLWRGQAQEVSAESSGATRAGALPSVSPTPTPTVMVTPVPEAAMPEPTPAVTPTPSVAGAKAVKPTQADLNELYDFGRQLFDDYAPEQIKDQYEFLSKAQWDEFTGRLQNSLETGSLDALAKMEPEARRTLAGLRLMPDFSEYADWLGERLDLIESARLALAAPSEPSVRVVPSAPVTPDIRTPENAESLASLPPLVPYYDLWIRRMEVRPRPVAADGVMPLLQMIFTAEGLPKELAWVAEVESSFNPTARSPAGARGLFQLMPATAKRMGLSLFPFDERTNPGKNARAAARLLRGLHQRFDSWPLALAAYNAGEGRVAAALRKVSGVQYADIADVLPAETRMYVPKVLATIKTREGVAWEQLKVPARSPSAVRGGKAEALADAP